MTKAQILRYAQDITALGDHFLVYANRGKIKQFEKKYGGLATAFLRHQHSLQDEYFIIENNAIKMEEKDGKQVHCMKEGKTLEEYMKVYNDYFSKDV